MKKIFLFSILLFQLTFVFGQNKDWGSWTPVSCYSRLSTSVLGNGYVPSIKEYSWQIKIKSTYSKKVTFNMTWIVGGERLSIGQVTLSPNESYGHTPRYFKSSSNNIVVEVSEVCFEGQDCYKYGYADCNGNQAKIPNNSSSTNSTNQTNTTNQQTTQQNDLSEYNRSKADIERQMAEKNAEITRQNQENTNKLNIWNNAIKAGVSAHNSGNYTEAKNQFIIAINNSTNESNRQNAQNYYNKSVEAEKSQGKIKAVGDLVQGTLQILGDAHERKMQKLNAEIAELQRKNSIVEEDQKINTLNDPKIFETYCDYVAYNLEKIGFIFEKLENYTNIENKEKTAFLKFNGLKVFVNNRWSYGSMSKFITFVSDNQTEYQKLVNSIFFNNLSQLNPNYNKSYSTFDNTNISTIGLEKQEDFLGIYDRGYTSKNYIGFINLTRKLDEKAQNKIKNMGTSTTEIIEKAKMYALGIEGVKKNYEKAIELYQNAYNQNNDKELILKIGELYKQGDEYLAKNENKAVECFLNYLKDNDNINPRVYVLLADIYDEEKSSLYDIRKTEKNLLDAIPIAEKKYISVMDEPQRKELKNTLASIYSSLCILYQYKLKSPTLFIEYAEKKIQWEENDQFIMFTAYDLAKLYADGKFTFGKKDDDFKKDKKKAKYWASKVCEIADKLENKNSGSSEANNSKKMCELLHENYKNLF